MQPTPPTFPCPRCQTAIAYGQPQCPQCGQTFLTVMQGAPTLGDDAGVRMLLPVGRTALSIIAGYIGLISLVAFPLGPVAILLGILAAREIGRKPGAHGMGRAVFAIVAGSIGTLVGILVLMRL